MNNDIVLVVFVVVWSASIRPLRATRRPGGSENGPDRPRASRTPKWLRYERDLIRKRNELGALPDRPIFAPRTDLFSVLPICHFCYTSAAKMRIIVRAKCFTFMYVLRGCASEIHEILRLCISDLVARCLARSPDGPILFVIDDVCVI